MHPQKPFSRELCLLVHQDQSKDNTLLSVEFCILTRNIITSEKICIIFLFEKNGHVPCFSPDRLLHS